MQIMPRPRVVQIVILLLALAALFSVSLSFLLPRLLDLNRYQTQFIEILQKQLNRQVRLGSSKFLWVLGPSFVFNDLSIQERGSNLEFLSARRVSFRLSILPLLNKKIELREIVLDGVRVTVSRDKQGKLTIDDLLQPTAGAYELQLKEIRVRNGALIVHDEARAGHPVTMSLSGINLSLDKPLRGKKCAFKLAATLEGKTTGSIESSGTFRLPKPGKPLKDTEINAKLALNQVEYWQFWHYFEGLVPFPSPGGAIDLDLAVKGRWQNLQVKGSLLASNPAVDWPAVFHAPVAPKQLKLAVDLTWSPSVLDMHSVQVSLDGFSAKGNVRLSDLGSGDPAISASLKSEQFDYIRIRNYIPFGIIPEDPADFIEHKIRGGLFRLSSGTLNGRISQLVHFGSGNNANVLSINGTVEQGSIQYGEKTPTFQQIKGNLEMKGRNFNLIGMSGNFGSAPFTLDGSIKEYATTGVPTMYAFSMQIAPRPAEVAWLAEIVGIEALRFQGTTTALSLQGDGPSSAYRLSGEWLLTAADYEYPAVVKKPAGMNNSLSFSAVLDKDATRFTSFSYQLLPLKLSGNGLLRYSGDIPHLAFDIETNTFLLNGHLPILTLWQSYQLNGGMQAHILGSGDPRSLGSMQFTGNVALNGFSVRPHPQYAPITAINSRIHFKGNSLETSDMAIRYGTTALNVKGRILSLKDPEAELFITSPELNPVDFGVSGAEKPPKIKQFSTQLSFGDGLLKIHNIAGKLPKTIFSASGTVRTGAIPDIKLRVAATYLDLHETLPLLAPSRSEITAKKQTPDQYHLQTYLTAETGSYRNTTFSNLSAYLKNEGGILKLEGLNTNILGGKLSLHGQLGRVEGRPPQWDLSFLLDRAKAAEMLQMLGIGREIKGLSTVKGTLTATGDDIAALKKTAHGTLSLSVERGTLRRFSSLSKIISILNVSQLFSLSLPDMAHDGMPFNRITATIGVKDGILTTQDFFIDSNVMHITSVGSIDIVREKIDMLIGVQPLQTVDRIVSRIPVVGWILSGGDGSLVTTYFEAKGDLNDPNVSAIPVKSIATGTLNIFRRVFELPVRLFTDSGEVILGNQKERPKAKVK